MDNNSPAFRLWRRLTINLALLVAAIAFAHFVLIAGVVLLMAFADFNPSVYAYALLASPAAGYTVPIGIAARQLLKQFDSLLRDASANPDPETP